MNFLKLFRDFYDALVHTCCHDLGRREYGFLFSNFFPHTSAGAIFSRKNFLSPICLEIAYKLVFDVLSTNLKSELQISNSFSSYSRFRLARICFCAHFRVSRTVAAFLSRFDGQIWPPRVNVNMYSEVCSVF